MATATIDQLANEVMIGISGVLMHDIRTTVSDARVSGDQPTEEGAFSTLDHLEKIHHAIVVFLSFPGRRSREQAENLSGLLEGMEDYSPLEPVKDAVVELRKSLLDLLANAS